MNIQITQEQLCYVKYLLSKWYSPSPNQQKSCMPFKLPVCKVSFTDTWWLCTVYKKSLKIPKGTTQWPKEKVQKDKQRSTKLTHKTKDRVTRTPLKPSELRCSGRVSSSCSTSGIHRVNLVTNPEISHEWRNDRQVYTTSGTYPW